MDLLKRSRHDIKISPPLLRHFGIRRTGQYTNDDFDSVRDELAERIENREMIALTGRTGIGKSYQLRRARRKLAGGEHPPRVVEVKDLTPNNTTMQNVVNAIIKGLRPDDALRSNFEERTRQCERILFEQFTAGRPPVVIIEDAHRLEADSLSNLKRLREAEFRAGPEAEPVWVAPAIVLLGWRGLRSDVKRHDEVSDRTAQIHLSERTGFMTRAHRAEYLEAVFGPAITPETRQTLAHLAPSAEALNNRVEQAMREARLLGFDVVDERVIEPTLLEMKEAAGISYKAIEKETQAAGERVADSTIQERAQEPHADGPEVEAAKRAIERIQERQAAANGQAHSKAA